MLTTGSITTETFSAALLGMGGAEGFSGDRAGGEHGSCVTAANVALLI